MRVALVLGGAGNVWDDVEAALKLGTYAGAVACNDIGAAWPGKLDAIVSLHAEKLGMWAERRRRAGYVLPERILTHHQARSGRIPPAVTGTTEFKFPGQIETGSSGLFALKVALDDCGFDRAVLCGVPMQMMPGHFFDASPWDGANAHKLGWNQALPIIKNRARSMSGWTAELLGSPDKEWLTA